MVYVNKPCLYKPNRTFTSNDDRIWSADYREKNRTIIYTHKKSIFETPRNNGGGGGGAIRLSFFIGVPLIIRTCADDGATPAQIR